MAHGYLGAYCKEGVTVYSAGIETHGVNPKAIEVMKEEEIDISNHTSNHIDEYKEIEFDLILTVCDHANEKCPYFPSKATRIHENFPDPAKAKGSGTEIMVSFRKTRDMIKHYCLNLVEEYSLS